MSDTDAPYLLYFNAHLISEFWYKEENEKIYRYDKSNGIDIPLYDFNLYQGLEIVNGDGERPKVIEEFHDNE